ncbi:PREDICTED: ribokinase-like [Ipomoea nil]|uniref:ribokinase-like n=1 Tax=Ipomoea nil TaxID=35883 RepID=UPI0009015B7D|nr:PREDICTED: ribokinase-like [Ipomoea nil]
MATLGGHYHLSATALPGGSRRKSSGSPLSSVNFSVSRTRVFKSEMSVPSPPEDRIVLGVGGATVDFLAVVASYPKPDDKIRSTSFEVQGGGNTGNALTCAARLGLNPRIISKVANDGQGKGILDELDGDGVDTSFMVVSEGGNSPFSYIIVDSQTKTRTCIHTPGEPPMKPEELSQSHLLSAIDGARIVYFDGRLYETACVVAKEASSRSIPILVDAERARDGLDDLLNFASYVVCSTKFPQAWTDTPTLPSALISMLIRLPNVKFVVVTLGEEGCIMLERTETESTQYEEIDIDDLYEILKQRKDANTTIPTCIPSNVAKLRAKGVGMVCGRLLLGTTEKIPPSELVDTTGAGDAFIGAILYSICADMPPEKMLPFAAQVAAIGCRALGARAGLPRRDDPRLTPFLV